MRIIRYEDLEAQKKIPFTREHLRRLEAAGKFPRRVRLVEGGNYFGWIESEIDAYLEARAAARVMEAA